MSGVPVGAMRAAARAPRPAGAAAARRKKKKKVKKTKAAEKQLLLRAEATAAERAAAKRAAAEAARRARHLKTLSRTSGAERELEELVFGDSLDLQEDELLQRLAGPRRVGLGAQRAAPAPTAFPGAWAPPAGGGAGAGFCSLALSVRCCRGCHLPAPVGSWAKTVCLVVFSLMLRRGKVSRRTPVTQK